MVIVHHSWDAVKAITISLRLTWLRQRMGDCCQNSLWLGCNNRDNHFLAGLRLLGIGRNQYIDLMNQCRSSKVG